VSASTHPARHDQRDDRPRVVCTFLAAPDADARLRRVYEILLRDAATEAPPDHPPYCPPPVVLPEEVG
jgi:hypothetical protein